MLFNAKGINFNRLVREDVMILTKTRAFFLNWDPDLQKTVLVPDFTQPRTIWKY